MTNESKAIQILRTIRGSWIPPIGAVFSPIECMQAMMAMAEWKDHQLKEYLEKKREHNSASCFMEEYGQGIQDGIENILEEIINEFFKEK